MQKTLILGVLFACTTITSMDTPPIAKLTSDTFDHSDNGFSPEPQGQDTPPNQNFNSSFSLRPDNLQPSLTPTHSTQASPNHFQLNNSLSKKNEDDKANEDNKAYDGRPSTPVKENDEEYLRLYQEIINACLTRFNQNVEKAKKWETEQRAALENARVVDTIAEAMSNPDYSSVVSAKTKSAFSKIQKDYPFKSKQPFSANGQYPSKTRE